MKKLLVVIMLSLFFGGVSLTGVSLAQELSASERAYFELLKEYRNPTKIHIGMNREQVIEAWGYPSNSSSSRTQYSLTEVWTYSGLTRPIVYLTFVNDKLERITHP
jgi:outer membrane protein assembly factor BamE (lipoprotein component of BamABCDE complex)